MKKLFVVLAVLVLVIGLVACQKKEEVKPSGDVIESGERPFGVSGELIEETNGYKETDPYVANIPNEILDAYKEKIASLEEAHKKSQSDYLKKNPKTDITTLNNLKYDLIFLDDNRIPELVVYDADLGTRLYTYNDEKIPGKVVYAMGEDENDKDSMFTYTLSGMPITEYSPRDNIIRRRGSEENGYNKYTFYVLDEETHLLKSKYEKDLYITYDTKEEEPSLHYHYGDDEIAEVEWKVNYLVDGNYVELKGTRSATEITMLLDGLVNEK